MRIWGFRHRAKSSRRRRPGSASRRPASNGGIRFTSRSTRPSRVDERRPLYGATVPTRTKPRACSRRSLRTVPSRRGPRPAIPFCDVTFLVDTARHFLNAFTRPGSISGTSPPIPGRRGTAFRSGPAAEDAIGTYLLRSKTVYTFVFGYDLPPRSTTVESRLEIFPALEADARRPPETVRQSTRRPLRA